MSLLDRFLCWIGIHDQIVRETMSSHSRGYTRTIEVTNCARCGRHGFKESKSWELPG